MTSSKARAELERLVADGLQRYRRGDVDGALAAWEAALQAVPGDPRAIGYVDYVRQNYEHLVPNAPSPMAELLVPFELGATRDADEYEVSISRGRPAAPPPTTWRGGRLVEPAVGDGWPIETEKSAVGKDPGVPRRPAPAPAEEDAYESITLGQAGRSSAEIPIEKLAKAAAEESGEETLGGYQATQGRERATVDLAFDFGGREATGEPTLERSAMPPARRTARLGDAPLVEPGRAATPQTLRGGTTRPPAPPRPPARTQPPPPRAPAPYDDFDLDLGLGLSLDLDLPNELGIETVVPGAEPTGAPPATAVDDRAVHVEELRLPPPTSARVHTIDNTDDLAPPLPPLSSLGVGPSEQLLAEIDRDRPRGEAPDDTARRRITRLIERARAAASGGEPDLVIVAIELALAQAPDSAVAQKLIHKNRDVLLDCYYRFFGSLDKRPVVTGNLSELKGAAPGRAPVDPRAAFLLSRIDGMLTYDELLDVAGMGRLEACRHLAHLIGRGLVRST